MLNLFIGEIILVTCGYAPVGTLPCDGRVLPVTGNTNLYSILRNNYGGNGNTTFGIPLLAPPFTASGGTNPMYCIVVSGIYPLIS
ncbi:MAG: phage tail protein [Rhodoferax sp.]|nr:phage tail protein [Rhodoferax sp.]